MNFNCVALIRKFTEKEIKKLLDVIKIADKNILKSNEGGVV